MQAGLTGAAIAGTWTGMYELVRVRNKETTGREALRATANSAAIGAGAGAVAHVVSHVARSVPILGLAVLAAGVLYAANAAKKESAGASGPKTVEADA
ncbi:hypothetical protein BV509_20675 [Rhodovulum sulfidophilum]|nr:hypothetical protein BV509_20675 [Rhodovulum sulfidophilum]